MQLMQKDYELSFIHFTPSARLESQSKFELAKLMELAPDGAICTTTVEKSGKWYICRLVISSVAGAFYATTFNKSPRKALLRGIFKIGKKLESWKGTRFRRPTQVESVRTIAAH